MDRMPKFICNGCGKKLEGPGHIIPSWTYNQEDWEGPISPTNRYCDECNKKYLGENTSEDSSKLMENKNE